MLRMTKHNETQNVTKSFILGGTMKKLSGEKMVNTILSKRKALGYTQ